MNSNTTSSVTKTYSSFFKIVFLGIRNVGKTSIIRRILDLDFSSDYSPTIGIRFHNLSIISNEEYNIQLWDISGNNIYSDYIQAFLKNTDVLVLVFDYKNKESQNEIIKLYEQCIQTLSNRERYIVRT